MQEEKKSKSFTFFYNWANILSIKISPLVVLLNLISDMR